MKYNEVTDYDKIVITNQWIMNVVNTKLIMILLFVTVEEIILRTLNFLSNEIWFPINISSHSVRKVLELISF